MNDFTKEELIKLHIALEWVKIGTPDECDINLLNKVLSMIENYREHDVYLEILERYQS